MSKVLGVFSKLAVIILGLFLCYFAYRTFSYHYSLVTFPFADGLREGAMMTSTDALCKGLNPYAFALQPRYMNQYGIIYPLFVWPFAKFFGTTILVHRIVTAFFIMASCLLLFLAQRRLKVPFVLNIWAVLMLYASLVYPVTSTPTIDAGAPATFFFLLTVLVPWYFNFSFRSLFFSVLFGIIAFYTKPYVFIGAFIIMSYIFLFVSRSKGFYYGILFLILSALSVILVNWILPAYFDNCFFTSANMAKAWSSMDRLHENITKYWGLNKWIFALIGLHILWFAFKKAQEQWFSSMRQIKKDLSFEIQLFVYAACCSSLILYMSLGRHSGALLWYFFQLLSPFLLICASWVLSRPNYWPIWCVPILILTLHTMTIDDDAKIFDKNMANWPQLTELLKHHQHVLNSSLIAPLLIQDNKDIVDDGQAEYFGSGGERKYWMKGLFKEDDRIFLQLTLFFENIRENVQGKKYDLIVLQPSLLPMGVADEIRRNYKLRGQFLLYAPQDRRAYALTIWLPN